MRNENRILHLEFSVLDMRTDCLLFFSYVRGQKFRCTRLLTVSSGETFEDVTIVSGIEFGCVSSELKIFRRFDI